MTIKDRVRATRAIFAVVAVVYPLFGFLRDSAADAVHDPLSLRYVVSLTAIVLLGLSFSVRFSRRYLYPLVMVLVYFITGHFFYLLAANGLDAEYLVGLLIVLAGVLAAGPLAFRTRSDLVVYLGFVSAACLGSIAWVDEPTVSVPFYVLVVFTTVGLSYIALGYQLSNRRRLIESQRRLDAVVQGAPVVLWAVDRSGRVSFANSRVIDATGESAEEYIGRPLSFLLGHSREMAEATERALSGETASATIELDDRVFETLQVPQHGSANEVVGVVGVATDVTERDRARRELEHRERQLRDAQAIAHCGSWEWNIAEDRVDWSDETYRIFGIEPGKPLSHQDFLDRLHEEDRPRIEAIIADAVQDPKSFEFEERIVRPGGEVRVLRNRGRVVTDRAGRSLRMIGTCYDITEIQATEEQMRRAQRMEAVGRVAGGIAHDFNNLLTIIQGFSQDLVERLEDPTDRDSAAEIDKAAGRAADLTRKLLTFSRRSTFRVTTVDVRRLVEDVQGLLERVLAGKGPLTLDIAPDVGAVRVDPESVEQVLMNLVINARDAIEEKGRVTVVARNVEMPDPEHPADVSPGSYVVVDVRDTGAGIEPVVQDRIFEPFFTTKAPGKGTGLGLSTVYGIMRQVGGEVTVESRVGEGTTFHLYFPRSTESDSTVVGSAIPTGERVSLR